jgi:truncated hemoglobin YjbI
MQTVFEAVGGNSGLRRLADAWHRRVMADDVVAHAFSHGFHHQHIERLAAYWAEALGGPYNRMNEAHDAIGKWMPANRREFAGHSWEIYGDPTPDPADTETTVVYLLK